MHGTLASGADEDILTLSEWGLIALGGVLVLILIRQRRPGVAVGLIVLPGAGLLVLLLSPDARASDASYTHDLDGHVLTRTTPQAGTTTYT